MEIQFMEDKATQYAYISIHHFFDCFGFAGIPQNIDSIIKAATLEKIWKKATPASLLFYMGKMEELCSAAFVIYYSRRTRVEAIIEEPANGQPDLSFKEHFVSGNYKSNVWNNFPRNLTVGQYLNPYRAIKKFCTYMAEPEWNKALKEFTEYALGKHTINELYPPYDILALRLRLLQLVEACHLLNVRINRKIANADVNAETDVDKETE